MELSKQVCSKEQAAKLKELGIEQKSLFYYHTNSALAKDTAVSYYKEKGSWISFGVIRDGGAIKYYSAFTASEVAQMLPFGNFCIPVFEGELTPDSDVMYEVHLETWITPNRFRTVLVDSEFRKKYMDSGIDYTIAESLTSMLITMLEKGVIDASYCNTRLNA